MGVDVDHGGHVFSSPRVIVGAPRHVAAVAMTVGLERLLCQLNCARAGACISVVAAKTRVKELARS